MYLDLFRMDNGKSNLRSSKAVLLTNAVTTAVVSSRMNFLTTYHQFSRAGIQEIPTVLNEPFRIPSPFPSPDPSKGVINLAFLPAHLQFRNGATGPATQYRDQDINFLVGISIDKSLAITQRIYSTDPDFQVLGTKFTSSISITEDEEMEEVDAAETGLQNIFTRRADLSEAYDAIFNQGDEVLLTVQDGDTANTVEGYCTRLMEQLATRAELGVMGVSSLYIPVLLPLYPTNPPESNSAPPPSSSTTSPTSKPPSQPSSPPPPSKQPTNQNL